MTRREQSRRARARRGSTASGRLPRSGWVEEAAVLEVPLLAKRDGVLFGPGSAARTGEALRERLGRGGCVLLVADPGVVRLGLAESLTRSLEAAGFRVSLFTAFAGDPKAAEIDAAAAQARAAEARALVALGGGSAMDVAKLAAAVTVASRPAADYALAAEALPENPLPIVCLPTTAGTGSELTRTAIFSLEDGSKVWAWGEGLAPLLAVLDPVLTLDLPRGLTVATGVDALVHAIEAGTTRRAAAETDVAALEAVGLIRRYLPRALEEPRDVSARAGVQAAAALAGIAIDGAGTGIAHALGHALGSVGRVHHGRAVGLSLRVALAWNAEAAVTRHAVLAEAFGVTELCETTAAARFAWAYDDFLQRIGMDLSLAGDGLSTAQTEPLTAALFKPENQPMLNANCRTVTEADARRMLAELLAA